MSKHIFTATRPKVLFIIIVAILATLITTYYWRKTLSVHDEYIKVEKSNYASTIMTTGKVTSDHIIFVKAEVTGIISACEYTIGDSFLQNEILLQFARSDFDRDLQQAKLGLDASSNNLKSITDKELLDAEEITTQARLEYEKAAAAYQNDQVLFEAGAISKSDLDNSKYVMDLANSKLLTAENNRKSLQPKGVKYNKASLDVRVAELQLAAARDKLEKSTVKAPFNGVILKKYFEQGELVEAGRDLFLIADNEEALYIKASVDEKYIPSLTVNQKVYVRPEAFEDIVIEGQITKIAPSVDSQKGTIDIEVTLTNSPEFLKRDLSVSLEIVTQEYQDVIVLEKKYIDFSSGSKIWIKEGRSKEIRDIEILHDLGDKVIVGSGLQAGELIGLIHNS